MPNFADVPAHREVGVTHQMWKWEALALLQARRLWVAWIVHRAEENR